MEEELNLVLQATIQTIFGGLDKACVAVSKKVDKMASDHAALAQTITELRLIVM